MRGLFSVFVVVGLLASFVSTLLLAYFFYMLGFGAVSAVSIVEPNVFIAKIEMAIAIIGLAVNFVFIKKLLVRN